MKFRKDKKIPKKSAVDSTESKVEDFITEVVDIHRSAFDEAKKFFDDHFEDVNDFDSLKSKVEQVLSGFIPEIQSKIENLSAQGEAYKQEALNLIEKAYGEKQAFLQNAQARAERFVDTSSDVLKSWISEATKKLDDAYEKLKMEMK